MDDTGRPRARLARTEWQVLVKNVIGQAGDFLVDRRIIFGTE